MPPPLSDRTRGARRKVAPRWQDEARFIRTWFENPRGTGAVSPSGRWLSRAIAQQVDPSIPGPVVELGPGTGPVTEALIRRGITPERLILIEYEAAFCRLLARRFPLCRIIQGDAYALARTLRPVLSRPAAAIVSSLPLLNRPDRERLALLGDALMMMEPGSPFVQFTYGLASPIPRHAPASAIDFDAHATAPVWLNLPPARVWTYRAHADGEETTEPRDFLDKIGDEWREQRDRLRGEWIARSAEAKAEWQAKTLKVKTGLARHGAKLKAVRDKRAEKAASMFDERSRWRRDP